MLIIALCSETIFQSSLLRYSFYFVSFTLLGFKNSAVLKAFKMDLFLLLFYTVICVKLVNININYKVICTKHKLAARVKLVIITNQPTNRKLRRSHQFALQGVEHLLVSESVSQPILSGI